VLVAADNSADVAIVRRFMAHWGAKVLAVSTCPEIPWLLQTTISAPPDALICVPESSGAIVQDLAKHFPDLLGRVIPVVCFLQPFCLFGAPPPPFAGYTYLTKPLRRESLKTALQEHWQPASIATGANNSQQSPETTRVLRILVAEDNAVNQKVIARMLEKLGHTVTIVADGHEALIASSREPFDMIFMDMQMPVLDGLAATQAIREAEKSTGAHIHIVALTANAFDEDRRRCLEAGMDRFLAKPVSLPSLRAELEEFFRLYGSETELHLESSKTH